MSVEKYPKLSVISLALSLGIVLGGFTLATGWIAITGWGASFVNTVQSVYVGYTPSFWGGIIGGIWGFIDGFIGGLVIGLFYNFFRGRK